MYFSKKKTKQRNKLYTCSYYIHANYIESYAGRIFFFIFAKKFVLQPGIQLQKFDTIALRFYTS